MSVIGTAAAIQGVTVSADLPGTVDKIDFESGKSVQAGGCAGGARHAAGAGAVGRRRGAARSGSASTIDRTQELVKARRHCADRTTTTSTAQKKATEAQVGEIKATIERKTIRAPFSGILGIRQVNLGQYLAAGEAIVPLQSLNPIYVNFGVPQQDCRQDAWRGGFCGSPRTMLRMPNSSGRVTALDSVINEATRNVQVQATLANPEGQSCARECSCRWRS